MLRLWAVGLILALFWGCDDGSSQPESPDMRVRDMNGRVVVDAAPDTTIDQGADAAPEQEEDLGAGDAAPMVDMATRADAAPDEGMPDMQLPPDAEPQPEGEPEGEPEVQPEPEPNPITLRVSAANGPVNNPQIVEAPELDQLVVTGTWEFCAEGGDIDIAATSTRFDGWFSQLSIISNFGNQAEIQGAFNGHDQFVIRFQDQLGQHGNVADGECELFTTTIILPHDDEWSEWIHPVLEWVEPVDEQVQVIYEREGGHIPGIRTILTLEDGISVRPINGWEEELVFGRNQVPVSVGAFEFCTEPNGRGSLDQALFRTLLTGAEGGPLSIPLNFEVSFVDWETRRWFDLPARLNGQISRGEIFAAGEEFIMETRLLNGEAEDLSWGACLTLRFSVPIAPRNVDTVQMELLQASSDVTVMALGPRGTFELSGWEDENIIPFPWTRIRFIDPVEFQPEVVVDWVGTRGSPRRESYYLYAGQPDPCSVEYLRHNEGLVDEDFLDRDCPIVELIARPKEAVDRRFPFIYRNPVIRVVANQFIEHPVPLRIEISGGRWNSEPFMVIPPRAEDGEEQEFLMVEAGDEFPLPIPEFAYEAGEGDFWRLQIRIFIDGEIPEVMADSLVTGDFHFVLQDLEAEHQEIDAPVTTWAPVELGHWEFGHQDLPYHGPTYRLRAPAIWHRATFQGEPIVLDLAEYAGEIFTLLEAVFDNVYGEVEICGMTLEDLRAKDASPVRSFVASVNEVSLGQLTWDRQKVQVFGACAQIDAESPIEVRIQAADPREVISADRPLQLQLTQLVAFADGELILIDFEPDVVELEDEEGNRLFLDPWADLVDWMIQVLLREEGQRQIFLGAEHRVYGRTLIIRNSADPDGDRVCDFEIDIEGACDSVGDNCPEDRNPDQADEDDDGVGDVCDPDFAPEE